MAHVLFLVHRLPYPPNKGDKVRSYHLLKHLAQRHQVHLGTFIDDPDDRQHLPAVQRLCADVHAATLTPRLARIASLGGLFKDQPLTLGYYRDAGLRAWVSRLQQRGAVDAVVVFSSSMAQYAMAFEVPLLVDFVDVDSAKWKDYAPAHRWPLSWLYRREGHKLLSYERQVALRAHHSFLATEKEAQLFRALAPESAQRVGALVNGVDCEFFAPDPARASPFAAGEVPLVFTGAMDYWPNIDAVCWFATHILPGLQARRPGLHFYVVGRNPSAAVRALQGAAVTVTGTVADVRPYLQHAGVVVAPLRLARGIQNKVLEAMAMARPVVAAGACVQALDATPGTHLVQATEAADYVHEIDRLLADPTRALALGDAGRRCVQQAYGWAGRLAGLDTVLNGLIQAGQAGPAGPATQASQASQARQASQPGHAA